MSALNKWMPLLVLPFLLAACLILWAASGTGPYISVQSEGDIWDLRDFDFSDPQTIVRLNGPVAYIPNALLTPGEFEARADETVYGYPEDEKIQYATSRMHILIPEGWYGVYVLSVDFSERLYVNGSLMLEIGSPGDSKETTVPDTASQFMTLTPVDGVIELVVQSSNFVHREGGGHGGWKVGNPEALRTGLRGGYLTNMVMGCYLALFLVHMILFLLLRTYRANLLFALSCLMWFLRSGMTWTKVFSFLFSWMSWVIKFRIEYLSFPVTAALFIGLIHTLFPGYLQKWFLRAAAGAMAVFTVIFLFADTLFMSWAILWCEGVFVLIMIYIVARFVRKLRRVTPEQTVFLLGAALFLYAAANDMLSHNNVTNILFFPLANRDMSQISMLIFAFFEAAAIFIATTRGIGEVKAEEQRLAARVQMTENQLALQREQYEKLAQNAKTISTMRHDLEFHLTAVRKLADVGDTGGINTYIEQLDDNMTAAKDIIYCKNITINAVIAQQLDAAEREGVTVETQIHIPDGLSRILEMDLCLIMGNLLKNALEACRCMEHGEKFIHVRSRIADDTLSIIVSNSFDGLWHEENGVYLSRKESQGTVPREGVGLLSVKTVCEKHRGLARYEINGSVWKSSVLVHMKQDNAKANTKHHPVQNTPQ